MQLFAPNETEHLASARAGNPEAFTALVAPYRQALVVHCYRMSGSLDDAEDLVQETFLRAWKKIDSFKEQGSFRNWLFVIATRQWLDEARRRQKRVLLPLDGPAANPDSPPRPPASPASWLDPLPGAWLASVDPSAESSYELRETISIAFMVALHKLNARQRTVLILRAVYDWRADEVAEVLGLTVASVNNLLYRARKNLEAPEYEEIPAPKQSLDRFVSAWESGDVEALVELLHENATFAMPPMGVWYAGKDSIQRALRNFVLTPDVKWKLMPTSANGRVAFAIYRRTLDTELYQTVGLVLPICSQEAAKLIEIIAFLSPPLVKRFGLPQSVAD